MNNYLIQRIKTYDAGKMDNKQLSKDWFLAVIWYSSLLKGKKFKFTKEDVIALAKKIKKEIDRRVFSGKMNFVFKPDTDVEKDLFKHLDYMPIFHGTVSRRGTEISLDDVLSKLRNFTVRTPLAWIVGSLANWERTDGDIDILINATEDEPIYRVVKFRILRAFPIDMRDRVHCFPNSELHGPFTDCVELYNLSAEIGDRKRIEMADSSFESGATISKRDDKIILMRPFFMAKPTHGREISELYSTDSVIRTIKTLKWDDDVGVEIKYDGLTCVNGYARIWTDKGVKTAREICEGDFVLTHKGRFRKVTSLMKRNINYDEDRVFKAKVQGGSEFSITGEHPILSQSGEWIATESFAGKACRPKILLDHTNKIETIEISDQLGYLKEVAADKDFFYFIGFFIGDGNLGHGKNRNRISLFLGLNDDKERILKIITDKLKIPTERISIYRQGNMYHVCWYDPVMQEWLSNNFYSYTGKAFRKSIPDWFDNLNNEQLLSFIEGWDDSDTCVTVSSELAGRIGMLCLKKGIFASILHTKATNQTGYETTAYKVRIYKKEIEENNDFFFPKIWLNEIKLSAYFPKLVYNFEVEEDNSYVVEGIAVHNCQAHKKGNEVKIWTEQGRLLNLPEIEKELSKKKDDFVVIGELEVIIDGKHLPRADTAGIVNSKTASKEDVRFTLYDKLYLNEDIHNLPYSERRIKLKLISDTDHVKVSHIKVVKSEAAIKDAIEKISKTPGAEGAMIKRMGGKYDLDKSSRDQIKYKKERFLIGRVKNVHPIKGAKAWNYDMAVDGTPYVGKSYNTGIQAEKGDLLKVVFVDISEYHDGKIIWFNYWAPRILEKVPAGTKTTPVSELQKMVKETTGRIEDKKIPARFAEPLPEGVKTLSETRGMYLVAPHAGWIYEGKKTLIVKSVKFNIIDQKMFLIDNDFAYGKIKVKKIYPISDDDFRKREKEHLISIKEKEKWWGKGDLFAYEFSFEKFKPRKIDVPQGVQTFVKEVKFLEASRNILAKRYGYVLQLHFRGRSLHGDMRFEKNDHLEGYTLAIAEEGVVKKPVLTMEDAKIASKSSKMKMDFASLEVKERNSRDNLLIFTKSKQPKEWLDFEGVTKKPEEGEPIPAGATKKYPGVFHIVSKGLYEMGADKPDFKEYFTQSGRITFRFIPGLKGVKGFSGWIYRKPDTQRPYVLSDKAVKDGWMPPTGQSALPTAWELKIPADMKYWEHGEKARATRDALVEYFKEKKELAQEEFVLSRRSWKGQRVIRDIPVVDYHMKFGKYRFHFSDKSPLFHKSVNAVQFSGLGELFEPGEYPPASKINPNKKIPVTIQIVDSGRSTLIEESQLSLHIEFFGRHMKGIWLFKRDSPKDELWEMSKSVRPKKLSLSDILFIKDNPKLSRRELAESVGTSKMSVYTIQEKLKAENR